MLLFCEGVWKQLFQDDVKAAIALIGLMLFWFFSTTVRLQKYEYTYYSCVNTKWLWMPL